MEGMRVPFKAKHLGKITSIIIATLILSSMLVVNLPLARADYTVPVPSFPLDFPDDFNYDGKVNSGDVEMFIDCYIDYWKHTTYCNPKADFDNNGAINSQDVADFIDAYIAYWGSPISHGGYVTSSTPVAYSDSFNFSLPERQSATVWDYVVVRFYVPQQIANKPFYFVATNFQGGALRKVQLSAVYSRMISFNEISDPFPSIYLGRLPQGSYLLLFQCREPTNGNGWFSFGIGENDTNSCAQLDRFRIQIPNYSNNEIRYTVHTHTYFEYSDDYFLKGVADDFIDDVRLGGGELYDDWQWDGEQDVFAWCDGFRYPMGYFSEQNSWKDVEFVFGEIWDSGFLDFQYVSYTYQKPIVGLPEAYDWCNAQVTDTGHVITLPFSPSYGNTHIVERKYTIGSTWADGSRPGLSQRFLSTSQEICLHDGSVDDRCKRIQLGFGIGWAEPKFSETAQFGAMINLTDLGSDGHEQYTSLRLENVKLDIYTPAQSVSISGLVYRDSQNPSDNIVELGGKIAVGSATAIINWQAGTALAAGIIGPEGMLMVLGATAAGKAIYDYVAGHQQEAFGESAGGTSTHRQIWYDSLNGPGSLQSMSHIVFVGLSKQLPKSCGAIKLVLTGEIVLDTHLYDNNLVESRTAFEMGIIMPIFAW